MTMLSAVRSWFEKPDGRFRARRIDRHVLSVECLEDRTLPSVFLGYPPPATLNLLQGMSPPPWSGHHMALGVGDFGHTGHDDLVFGDEALDRVALDLFPSHSDFGPEVLVQKIDPRTIRVADLNGDGNPDLLVADSAGNRLVVYLGLGHGQFAPGLQFATGADPVGITVGDLNGDGLPDVAVANQGSDTVSLYFGRGTGGHWSLAPGPQLRVGAGPVAAAIRDVTGNGWADLFVANSQSDNVYQINGLGAGVFDDSRPIIYPVGREPQAVFVGQFDGHPGLDLVTVNFLSDDLTCYHDIDATGAHGLAHTIALPGHGPLAALMGDLKHNGMDDLVVANFGDGSVNVVLGMANGPVVAQVLVLPNVPHPTDLALAGDNTAIYATGENGESVVRLDWSANAGLELPIGQIAPLPIRVEVNPPADANAEEPGARLVPVTGSGLAMVATSAISNIPELTIPQPSAPSKLTEIQEQSEPTNHEVAQGQAGADTRETVDADHREDLWFRFTSGQEEMLDYQRARARQRLREDEAEQAAPAEPDRGVKDGPHHYRETFDPDPSRGDTLQDRPQQSSLRKRGPAMAGQRRSAAGGMQAFAANPSGVAIGDGRMAARLPALDLGPIATSDGPPPLPAKPDHPSILESMLLVTAYVAADRWMDSRKSRRPSDRSK